MRLPESYAAGERARRDAKAASSRRTPKRVIARNNSESVAS
jgi:hypothetical protein